MAQDINLPEMGDGIHEGTVVSLAFKLGDTITAGATLVEIETDKAVLGVPASIAGSLVEWYVKEGDTLKVGEKLCKIETGGATVNKQPSSSKSNKEKKSESSDNVDQSAKISFSSDSSTTKATQEVNFTQLGDGINSGTVISLAVKVGDTVKAGDTLLELETDKAVVPFPSPAAGVVTAIHVKEGQEIKVGDKGLVLGVEAEGDGEVVQQTASKQPDKVAEPVKSVESNTAQSQSNSIIPNVTPTNTSNGVDYRNLDLSNVLAGPATRKLARELGVDLNRINSGSGRANRIKIEDVKKYVKELLSTSNTSNIGGEVENKPLPDFSKWGEVKREKTSKLRDTIANAITYAWQAIPHVHQYDDIYIDNILALQKKWKEDFAAKGSTLSVTPFIIKALAQCLKDFPQFNSSYDPSNKEVILKHYYHVGVAVDTPQGLIVPVIKNVDSMSIFDIGIALKTLAKQTRERTVKPEDLRGGCISLSNLGGIGGTHFNPIINWPEVAILGVGRGSYSPVYNKEKKEFIPSMVLPACLAYDHRVIDGADGARFMVQLKYYLENPDLLLMGIK